MKAGPMVKNPLDNCSNRSAAFYSAPCDDETTLRIRNADHMRVERWVWLFSQGQFGGLTTCAVLVISCNRYFIRESVYVIE
jgi:hypothetical protein